MAGLRHKTTTQILRLFFACPSWAAELSARKGWGGRRHITRTISDHLHLKRPTEEESSTYNLLQRLAYLAVVFLFFPVIILTGFAMSPNITSELPALVSIFGGQQSARTIHFFIANFLVLFLLVHIAMVCLSGFTKRVRAMITGYGAARKES